MVTNALTSFARVRRAGWTAAVMLTGVALLSARGDQFPAGGDFNGMAISYTISGATDLSVKDPPVDFNWTRTVTGTLGSGQLRVTGTARSRGIPGYPTDVAVRVWAGGATREFSGRIAGDPAISPRPQFPLDFDVSVDIPASATSGGFTIALTGHYNVGTRGLAVEGAFTRSEAAAPAKPPVPAAPVPAAKPEGAGSGSRDAAIAYEASTMAERNTLAALLARWQERKDADWAEAQRQKRIYDQWVTDNPDSTIHRSGALANEAVGRVEAADRLIGDLKRRLDMLGDGGSAPVPNSPREVAVADLAAKQAEEQALKSLVAKAEQRRAEDWAEEQRKKKEYDEYVRTHPPGTTIDVIATRLHDRSAAEAQQATGRVETADDFLSDARRRLRALETEIEAARKAVLRKPPAA